MGAVEERLDNIKKNIEKYRARIALPQPQHGRTCQLICFGPSLLDTWREIDRGGIVVSVSGAHDFVRDRAIVPTHHVEFDWRPHKALHVTEPSRETCFLLASCSHPDMMAKVPDPVLWHAQQNERENSLIKTLEPEAYLVPGGSSVGLRAIELFNALGYRRFEIHGMDSSFTDIQWAGRHFGKSKEKRDIIEVKVNDRKFKTSIAFLTYVDQFQSCKAANPHLSFVLHGDGLMQEMEKS